MTVTSPISPPPLTRDSLGPVRGACIHSARSSGQADVYELTPPWNGWLLKDFSRRPLWMRWLVTRRALAREARALRGLEGLEGIPRLACIVDADALVLEYLDAERLPHRADNFLTPVFFHRLQALVAAMHERGWAHGDLRRKNILVHRPTLRPYLIDFATAWHAGRRSGPVSRFLLRHWIGIDRVTVAKLKLAYLPHSLGDEDHRLLRHLPFHMKFGRFIRKKLYRPLKKRNRPETWRRLRAWIARGSKESSPQ